MSDIFIRMDEGCVNIFRAYTRHVPPAAHQPPTRGLVNHHVYLSLGDLHVPDTVIYCQLYSERRDTWVSERWCNARSAAGGQHTLFTDVSGSAGSDQGPDLFCVITIYRLGKIVNQQVGLIPINNKKCFDHFL